MPQYDLFSMNGEYVNVLTVLSEYIQMGGSEVSGILFLETAAALPAVGKVLV